MLCKTQFLQSPLEPLGRLEEMHAERIMHTLFTCTTQSGKLNSLRLRRFAEVVAIRVAVEIRCHGHVRLK